MRARSWTCAARILRSFMLGVPFHGVPARRWTMLPPLVFPVVLRKFVAALHKGVARCCSSGRGTTARAATLAIPWPG